MTKQIENLLITIKTPKVCSSAAIETRDNWSRNCTFDDVICTARFLGCYRHLFILENNSIVFTLSLFN